MYKLHSSGSTGNKKEAKIEDTCLSLVLVRSYTKDPKEKGSGIRLECQEYPNKTFVEAMDEKLNTECYNAQDMRRMN